MNEILPKASLAGAYALGMVSAAAWKKDIDPTREVLEAAARCKDMEQAVTVLEAYARRLAGIDKGKPE